MKVSKSDKLYLLLGGNPMPNILAASSRVKSNGEIICLYTKQTEKIFEKMVFIINEKNIDYHLHIKVKGIFLKETTNIEGVKKELDEKVDLDNNKHQRIELNFTGGTSVISTLAFEKFVNESKKHKKGIILSYLDTESDKLNLMIIEPSFEKRFEVIDRCNIDLTFNIEAKDILLLHNKNIRLEEEFTLDKIKLPKLTEKIFNEILIGRNHAIKFTDTLYYGTRNLNEKYKKARAEKKRKDIDSHIDTLEKAIFKENSWRFLKSKEDLFIDLEDLNNIGTFELKEVLKSISGFWLEDYVAKICCELKSEGVIKEIFSSVTRVNEISEDFEVDLVINTEEGIRSISITTVSDEEIGKHKLYEVKIRGKQLGGDESKIAYINFCNKKDLEKEYRDYWNDNLTDDLIIGYDELSNIKNIIREWIVRGK